MKKIFVVMILAIFALSGLAACNKSAVAFGKRGEIEKKISNAIASDVKNLDGPAIKGTVSKITFDHKKSKEDRSCTYHFVKADATIILTAHAGPQTGESVAHVFSYKCELVEDGYGEIHVNRLERTMK